MRRVIVDYKKLTSDILEVLVNKYPDGYNDSDIITFKNAKDEEIEALEIKTEDVVCLVKVGAKLNRAIEEFIEEEEESGFSDEFNDYIND